MNLLRAALALTAWLLASFAALAATSDVASSEPAELPAGQVLDVCGFGMFNKGLTSDHWIEEFYWWLEAQKLVQRAVHE